MAENRRVIITDDLDGTEGARTIRLAVENGEYEIDLNDENVDKLYRALDPYLSHARRVSARGTRTPRVASGDKQNLGAIRAWAQENGRTVSSRGRIPASILE